jgi:hypothetical protein
MLTRFFSVVLIIFSSFAPAVSQEIRYSFPANKHLPKSSFAYKNGFTSRFDSTQITVSSRLIPWSEYLGTKSPGLSISPDRMIYESLIAYCHLTLKGDRPYYFKAVDAQTKVTLSIRKIQYTKNLMSISPIAKFGQKEEYVRCGSV